MLRCKCWYCTASIGLSTFSHDAVRILASPASIAGGALNCKTWQSGVFQIANIKDLTIVGLKRGENVSHNAPIHDPFQSHNAYKPKKNILCLKACEKFQI